MRRCVPATSPADLSWVNASSSSAAGIPPWSHPHAARRTRRFRRRRPIPIEGSEFKRPVDTVLLALGYRPDPLVGEATPGLETHRGGLIVVDAETGETSRPGVFAGGDDVAGPDLVVTAIAHGRRAAEAIHERLIRRGRSNSRQPARDSFF